MHDRVAQFSCHNAENYKQLIFKYIKNAIKKLDTKKLLFHIRILIINIFKDFLNIFF
jgi:hypothetical protein